MCKIEMVDHKQKVFLIPLSILILLTLSMIFNLHVEYEDTHEQLVDSVLLLHEGRGADQHIPSQHPVFRQDG